MNIRYLNTKSLLPKWTTIDPFLCFLTAKLLLKITAESITQAGSPIISKQPSGRPQIPQEAGESREICAIPIPDQERTENYVSVSGELQQNPLDSQREDDSNQQERKELPERRPTFNDLRNQVKELAQDYSFFGSWAKIRVQFQKSLSIALHIWMGKLQSLTPETQTFDVT